MLSFMQRTCARNCWPLYPLPLVFTQVNTVPILVGDIGERKHIKHSDLHPVARIAREKLAEAFAAHLYAPYWRDDAFITSDMALALHPPMKKLKYMNDLRLTHIEGLRVGRQGATSDREVEQRRQRVYDAIKKRAVQAATKAMTGGKGAREEGQRAADLGPREPAPKRPKRDAARDERFRLQAEEFADLVDSSDEEADMGETPQGQVKAEWNEFLGMKKSLEDVSWSLVISKKLDKQVRFQTPSFSSALCAPWEGGKGAMLYRLSVD